VRVLHVTPYFAPAFAYGGPPRSVLDLCRSLQRDGVDVRVVTTTAGGDRQLPASGPGFVVHDGVPVHYAPLRWPPRYFNAAVGPALDEGLRWCDVCHVHGLWNVAEWMSTRRASRAGVPYVVSPRGMLEPAALKRSRIGKRAVWPLLERPALKRAARLHATSEREATTLRALDLGVDVAMIPNGVDTDAASRVVRGTYRRRTGLGPDAPLIAFLGRLHPIKRLDVLAEAFLRVRSARPDARLVIAGRDETGYRRTIEPLVSEAREAVTWTGELDADAKWELLADATVLVCCSDSESFGMSVAEAMAAGVPVVATHGCPWPHLDEWGCGSWVEQTPVALVDALLRVTGNPAAARVAGEKGRAIVAGRFAWEPIAAAMKTMYAGAIEHRIHTRDRQVR
jgi:glycosyltransferase involved in cell wall biosynthesis